MKWQKFQLARVTIELTSPFLVGSGEGDGLHDATFSADANGLPTIPGETLAGVLRHALVADPEGDPHQDELCRRVFGFQERAEAEASSVRVSFAQVHDANDRPVPFLVQARKFDDPVLAFLGAGIPRDHVRIGPHGAVDGRGKFDQLVVPMGARFTFELSLDEEAGLDVSKLIGLIALPGFRLGRSSRSGLGCVKVVAVRGASFDLTKEPDRRRLADLPVDLSLSDSKGILKTLKVEAAASRDGWQAGTLTLEPRDTWMSSGTVPSGREPMRDDDKAWDRFPLTERRIVWRDGKGTVTTHAEGEFVVLGSSIKGALRHRVAFHARRLERQFLEDATAFGEELQPTSAECQLFGEIRHEDSSTAGRLWVGDGRVSEKPGFAKQQHVSLDRLTQGPMDGLLFDELALYKGRITVAIAVHAHGLDSSTRAAFAAALDDLTLGRLGIGVGRGHGRCTGRIEWSDGGAWLTGGGR